MVVMGVYEAFRREGIQLGGLIVWGAGIGAWILVPWIIRELSRRKNREQDSEQRPPVEQKKEKYSTAIKPIRWLQVAIILIGCGLYVFTSECLIDQYSSSIIHKHGGATFVLAWFVFLALIIPFIKNILNKGIRFYKEESPEKSLSCLLILDEIGRGTSTFDGLSIAWAVVEHISNPRLLGAKTLFATHYHELTELEGKLNSVNNYCIAVKEKGDDIVFLRKIVKGGADKSYGIQVAKLAGVPDNVIERAKEIVEELSNNDITEIVQNISAEGSSKRSKPKLDEVDLEQISLLDTMDNDTILNELKELDLGQMTPIEAMNKLYELQNKVKNRW